MQLTIRLSASLRTGRFQERTLEMPEGATLAQLIDAIEVPENAIGILLVNGKHALHEDPLHAGDHVHLLPPIGGG